ncbi:MAG: hypothetical protein AAFP86_15720, partial [Planctomycetota bacterium]
FGSFATCLNADGTVVCGRGGAGWGYDYRWEEGVGATQLLAAGVSTSVVAVSADGSLAFGRGNDPASASRPSASMPRAPTPSSTDRPARAARASSTAATTGSSSSVERTGSASSSGSPTGRSSP